MMTASLWKRHAPHLAALVALAPALAAAQEWQIVAGGGSRAEYTDNYYYAAPSASVPTSVGPESAFTLSVIPFVAAVRRTEVSEVKALVSVGANKAWGVSEEYLTARTTLEGLLRDELSTWTGLLSYARTSELQNVITGQQIQLARTYTDSVQLGGTYLRRLTDHWSLSASVTGSYERYESVQDVAPVSDDVSFSAVVDARYAFSESTLVVLSLDYAHYFADLTRSDIVTTRAGVSHRFSPALTASLSVGWYWSDTREGGGTPNAFGAVGRDNGGLLGGSLDYVLSESTRLSATASQGLAPSGVGAISQDDQIAFAVIHRFSDALSGRIGASYTRTEIPGSLDSAYSNKTVEADAGLTWRFAERWALEAGYRYSRTRNSPESGEPRSNLVFVNLAYNWPGAALTGWIGSSSVAKGLTGAGPIIASEFPGPNLGAPIVTPSASEPQPFEPFNLP